MSNKTYYIIASKNYEYDDEYYRETEQFLDSLKTATDQQIMVVVDSLINPAYYIQEVEYKG